MLTNPKQFNDDKKLDLTLRPSSLDEYVGQEKIKENLKILIGAAKKRQEPIDHIILYGPSGMGKTSLGHIIAREIGASIKITSGPAIEKVGDLASILTNLESGDILFCDECHRLNKTIEETLYPAMEDYILDIIIGKGPSARTLQLELPHFTFIGATTRIGLISSPLRGRFGASYHLDAYTQSEIEQIIKRSAKILNVDIADDSALKTIASAARQTPRVANRLLKRVRDYGQVKNNGIVTKTIAQEALKMLEIDELGLEPIDRHLLSIIINKFNGGPVGLNVLTAAIDEEAENIEDVYEPYLLRMGLISRTARGRIATETAYKHLGIEYNGKTQAELF